MALGDVIARLSVQLNLDSAAFNKGAEDASRQTKRIGDNMEKMGNRVGTAIKGIAAAGVAIAGSQVFSVVKDLVVQGLEYASALGEQAQQLGVTSKALQEYRYVASQVGVSNDEMDAALGKLTRSLGEAAGGAKTQSAAFKTLGIDAAEFIKSGKDVGELIPTIADGLSGLGTDAEKSAVLVDILGKSGQKLLPLFNEGAQGINGLRDAAHSLGLVLSEEQIRKADDAADKFNALKQVLSARIAGVVADNADKIIQLANAAETLAKRAGQLYNAIVAFSNTPFAKALDQINQLARLASPIGLVAESFSRLSTALNMVDKAPKPDPKKLAPAVAWPKTNTGVPSSVAKPGTAPLGSDWTRGAGGKMGIAGAQVISMLPSIEAVNAALDDMGHRTSSFEVAFADFGAAGVEAGEGLKTSFEDAAMSVVSAVGQMGQALKGGNFLDILGGVLDIGLQLAGIGAFGKRIQSNVNTPHYANGTNFHPGGLALVGERGPELVSMPRGSKVTPNNKLGGGGNVYNINGVITTDEFWGIIQKGNANAAVGGANLAGLSMARSRKWALG